MPDIISRKAAESLGLKRYFTGKPCAKGHVDYRNTCDHACVACGRLKASKRRALDPSISKKSAEATKIKYQSNPEFRKKRIEDARRWVIQNQEKSNESKRQYYILNKEKYAEHSKARYLKNRQNPEWVEKERDRQKKKNLANPESKRASVRTRRARIKGAEGTHNYKDILKILESQNYECVYCKISLKETYDVDHIVAISRGGSNWPSNLQCLCPSCNARKWCKDHDVFAKEFAESLVSQ